MVSAQNTPSFADSDLTAAVGHFLSWWFTAIINCNTPYIHVGCKNYGRFAKRHFDFWLYWQKMSKGTFDQWQVMIAAFEVMNLSHERNHMSSTLCAGPCGCFWAYGRTKLTVTDGHSGNMVLCRSGEYRAWWIEVELLRSLPVSYL